MKHLLLALSLFSLLVSSIVSAATIKQNDDFVQLTGPYIITAEQAQKNVIHLYIPTDSVGIISLIDVVGFQGGDKFKNTISNRSSLSLAQSKDQKTIFIDNDMGTGGVTNIVLNTECGTDMSVTIHSISANEATIEQFKTKLSIYSLGCKTSNKS